LSTTTTTIKAGFYTAILAIVPSGPVYNRKTFRKAAQSFDADSRPGSDADREVWILDLRRDTIDAFGLVAGYECTCTAEVVVAHLKSGNLDEASARRDRDLHRIAVTLEKPASYTTDVWRVRLQGTEVEELEDRWYSTMAFQINAVLENS
jgi:hypothetical protein